MLLEIILLYSIALYILGFAESLVQTFPILDEKILALVTTVLVAAAALKSASFAIRAQFFIMAAIALSGAQLAQTNLENLMEKLRIKAIPEVLLSHGESFDTIIHRSSAHSDLIFMGIPQPDKVNDFANYYQKLQQRTSGLPTTVFVLAAPDFSFTEIFSG